MVRRSVVAFAFALFSATTLYSSSADTLSPPLQRTVEISDGNLRLKAFLWMPDGPGPFPVVLFNHGSGGATPDQTAGLPITQAATRLMLASKKSKPMWTRFKKLPRTISSAVARRSSERITT